MPVLLILYGTQTGNTERLALFMEKEARAAGISVTVKNMANFSFDEFDKSTNIAVIVSTHGSGEPPIQAQGLYDSLQGSEAPDLKGIRYAVLGLGDTNYSSFCQAAREFDHIFEKHGGIRLHERVDCDMDYEEDAREWISMMLHTICESD